MRSQKVPKSRRHWQAKQTNCLCVVLSQENQSRRADRLKRYRNLSLESSVGSSSLRQSGNATRVADHLLKLVHGIRLREDGMAESVSFVATLGRLLNSENDLRAFHQA